MGIKVTNNDDGCYTCLCKDAIPILGSYSFRVQYDYTGLNGGYVGVARGDKNLNEWLGQKGDFGLRSNGTLYLDSRAHYSYFSFDFS